MAAIFGTPGADSITGTGSSGVLPTLTPFSPELVFGGDGNDTIVAPATMTASLIVFGGNDADSIMGGGGNSVLRGENGNDTIVAGAMAFNTQLDGGQGNDSLLGGGANEFFWGGGDNDTIDGQAGNDVIDGGGGNDSIRGGLDLDRITTGFGNDTVAGDGGDDTVTDQGGNNLIMGGLGNDNLTGGFGNDSISGEEGNDTIQGGGGGSSIPGVANLLSGGDGNDLIFATFGADSIDGGLDNDTIEAGFGNNTIQGGAGNDVILTLGNNDSVDGGADNDVIGTGLGSDTVLGGSGNDHVDAGDGGDLIDGQAGNDTLLAGGGGDTVMGGAGSDRLDGGDGFDNLDYSALLAGQRVFVTVSDGFFRAVKRDANGVIGVDQIANFENYFGSAGDDKLTGWGQDETFIGGAGNDSIDGDDGFDTARFDITSASSGVVTGSVTVNLLTGVALDAHGGSDRLRRVSATDNSIESIVTGNGADSILGDADGNFLRGRGDADTMDGGAGIDTADYSGDSITTGVIVNLGTAMLGGVAGGTALDASGATDVLVNIEAARGTEVADTLVGGDVGNSFRGVRGADFMDGDFGNDTADYRSDSDGFFAAGTIPGGGGFGDGFGVIVNLSDTAIALAGFGAEGAMTIAASTARDGWGDTDTLVSIESARGSNFNDLLVGTQRELNFAFGGISFRGEDRSFMRGMMGNDTIRAVAGSDGVVASYSDDTSGIVARLDQGNTVIDGWGFTDVLVNVSAIQGSGFNDLIVSGNSGSWVRGRGGNDTLTGGTGFDVVSYGTAAAGAVVDLRNGTAVDGDGGTDVLSGFEWVSGSNFADTLIGDDDGNWFFGGNGADSIVGGLGQDAVSYYASWIGFASASGGVYVNLNTGTARDGDGSANGGSLDRFLSIEHAVGSHLADTLYGSGDANSLAGGEGADSLFGHNGDDSLAGGLGADTLEGGAGNDRMEGGAGDDFYILNTRFDLVVEVAGGGADTISAGFNLVMAAEVEGLLVTGALATNVTGNGADNIMLGNGGANTLDGGQGNDALDGAAGNDSLLGGLGNDVLTGGIGADTLWGSTGADTLTGGADADRFYFDRVPDSYRGVIDRITDFVAGTDDFVFNDTAGRLFAGITPTAIAFNGVVTVATASLGSGGNTYLQVLNGLNTALGGAANVSASGATLQAWQVNVTAGTAAGSYLFVNDGVAGAAPGLDFLVGIGVTGALSNADFLLS